MENHFLGRRRQVRSADEYRPVTGTEWAGFEEHFDRRKVELGGCARPYGTPCQHFPQHSCLRCPLLRPDPAQRPRLVEIRRNLGDRIAEAQRNRWLGEVEGLKVSLAAADSKLAQLAGLAARRTGAEQGGQTLSDFAGRTVTIPSISPKEASS